MRMVTYKTHWAYMGPAGQRREPLFDFVLDIPYLMDGSGVIPPFHVFDEVIRRGGDNGGMSPGTSWRPFKLKETEYPELVEALLALDVAEAKKKHPYLTFERVIVDETLHQHPTYIDWLNAAAAKYPKPDKH
jgi:hypothetical protein